MDRKLFQSQNWKNIHLDSAPKNILHFGAPILFSLTLFHELSIVKIEKGIKGLEFYTVSQKTL